MREQKRSCELHSFVHAEKCNWTDLEKKKKELPTLKQRYWKVSFAVFYHFGSFPGQLSRWDLTVVEEGWRFFLGASIFEGFITKVTAKAGW